MQGWRTLLFAALLAIAGVLETFDWVTVIPEGWVGPVTIGIGILVAWLRKITTTPIGEKPS